MPYYRALNRLTIGDRIINRGSIFNHTLSNPEKLITLGHIARLNTPPLLELPNWLDRSFLLAEHNINMGIELLESDKEELANKMGLSPHEIQQWKDELISLLTVQTRNRPCCGDEIV